MEENNSNKEKFFSKISHDLRGSFTSILGFSDILNDPDENLSKEEISDFSARIGKQSKESFDLLVNFINWLKLENYKDGLSKEKNEILDILYEIQRLLKKKIVKKNVQLKIEIAESEYVFMDYEIIHSILHNVLTFIIKTCSNNSTILITSVKTDNLFAEIGISAVCNEKDSSFLQNIDLKDLNNELSFPLIFATKFTELSGGKFDFSIDKENNLFMSLRLPKE